MNQSAIARSWVEHANGHSDFPLQNLPLGIFSRGSDERRCGVAIGDAILDLDAVLAAGLFDGQARNAVQATRGGALNAYFALGREARVALRERLLELLGADSPHQAALKPALYPAAECQLHLPARIGDYTDFYVGIEHAKNVGKLFRPDNPLLPNYKYVPIGYHGRASTIRPSGTDVRRPNGQTLPAGQTEPSFGPCARLDYELELGIWIGQGNAMGDAIPVAQAGEHVAGYCLLNDWSARDIQAWEYQPLGPFLSKNFGTSLSPWVVTMEALAPFRAPLERTNGKWDDLPYLASDTNRQQGALDIRLSIGIASEAMRHQGQAAHMLSETSYRHAYWTVAQMVAHHTVNGCNLQTGDLLGSGTLSGPDLSQAGALIELTQGGKIPVSLPDGSQRTFLLDGDEVVMRGWCEAPGAARIGFGECRAKVVPAM